MDLEMPVLNGFQATRRIKTLYPSCRVVALTIHDSKEERRKAFAAGVDVFVVKGAPVEELIAGIRGDWCNKSGRRWDCRFNLKGSKAIDSTNLSGIKKVGGMKSIRSFFGRKRTSPHMWFKGRTGSDMFKQNN